MGRPIASLPSDIKTVLCFGDSNTWGYRPTNGSRFGYEERWTGILQHQLGDHFHVVEEGLNGRTTIHSETERQFRSGLDLLPVILESHHPIHAVTVMLGTNDLKVKFSRSPKEISEDLQHLCEKCLINNPNLIQRPEIILISPSLIGDITDKEQAAEFSGAIQRSKELSEFYKKVAINLGTHFFDASEHVDPSDVDGVHWDANGHLNFAKSLAVYIRTIFDDR
ncbi:MAG: SGNH/GDSL hydrolase family protein [Planctomycetes bacterium]|nr:SGNH/GDSL hydrolase family protein [Planctomycetota bacterium]